ncbi:MAG: low molecular weight phosphotyrosine protein phosphatase [Rhizobacter sp.]|nr:low molecular weight phosphotyrosine protein phosphatase [Chlorobiales bacterium]
MHKTVRVLFVCMGNICRSPTAEAMFRRLVQTNGLESRITIDSAGTHAYHIGDPPDRRSVAAAAKRGLDLSSLRGRVVSDDDFETFDYLVAMDAENLQLLLARCPEKHQSKLHLFMDYAPQFGRNDVPDPYYQNAAAFDLVLELTEAASQGLLTEIVRRHFQQV